MRRNFARFCLVGLSNTALSFALFAVLLRSGLPASAAQSLAYAAGIAWSFAWNRRWVFGHRRAISSSLAPFVTLQLALLAASSGLIGLCVDILRLPPAASWLAIMAVVTVANFLLLRVWVFADRAAAVGNTVRSSVIRL